MQIRRLRLTGFKSFVEPTELRIEPGLTGVVGPNGCGKSNLLEAIRWVMGEASPKSLRGGGMEDVIFAGTSSRPPRDFAEVALIADLEGAAPGIAALTEDRDELEVVRRIERGAGSAYRANGRDVRAKDVALIFADAATGAHSPALVSQGKIAAVIAAKPAERRAMLEEAAGIAGLHVRRRDAEQKLRATETNLTRLGEHIADMEVRAASLKRQARAAERYRRLSDDIRVAEGRLIFARWRDAAAAADAAKAEATDAEAAVGAAQVAQAEAAATQQAAAVTLAEARRRAQDARDAVANAAQDITRLTAERDAITRRIADLTGERDRIVRERATEGDLATSAHASIAALDGEARDLTRTAHATQTERPRLETAMGDAERALRDAEVRLAQVRARVASEAADRRIAESAAASAVSERDRLRRERDRLQTETAALADDAALTAASHAADAEASAAEQDVAAIEAAQAMAEQAREAAQGVLNDTDAALADARATLAALDSELTALTRALETGRHDEQRALDAVRAAPGFEAALAAALGDDLDAAIGADVARGWRGTEPAAGSDPVMPAGTTALVDHVRAPSALHRRLAQVAVADTDVGQPLAVGQRLVTRDGRVRRWDGFVSDRDGATAAERLRRQNRRDELDAVRPQRAAAADTAATQRDAARAALNDANAAIAAARDRRGAADIRHRAALRAVDAAQAARDRNLSAARQLADRVEELAAPLARAEADATARASTLAALPDGTHAAQSLNEAEAGQAAALHRATGARHARDDHDRAAAATAARQAVVAAEIRGWKARAGEAARRLTDMDKRTATVERELESLSDGPARLAARLADAEQARAARQADAEQAANAEREGEAATRGVETLLADVQERLATAREARAGAMARAENAELRRVEMGRLSGERFQCPPPRLPTTCGFAGEDVGEAQAESARHDALLADRERIGPVNLIAADELVELEAEAATARAESDELQLAVNRLRGSIGSLNREGRTRLLAAFEAVNGHFQRLFTTLFNGGQAHLALIDSDDPLEAGLEIMAQPPGKRLGSLTLLSGGEQALTAVALIFALFLTNPAPICVLDEVDAPLDDANIERFCDLLDRMTAETRTRYLIVTHNAVTMARMHRLFGVTMVERGVSRLVSVDLNAAEDLIAAE